MLPLVTLNILELLCVSANLTMHFAKMEVPQSVEHLTLAGIKMYALYRFHTYCMSNPRMYSVQACPRAPPSLCYWTCELLVANSLL